MIPVAQEIAWLDRPAPCRLARAGAVPHRHLPAPARHLPCDDNLYMTDSLPELREDLRTFADERDWGQFHTSKNLVMALAGEVGELVAEFQWLTPSEAAGVMG